MHIFRTRLSAAASLAALFCLAAGIARAQTVDTPLELNIVGTITSNTTGVTVAVGNQILVVDPTAKTTVGTGSVQAADGSFLVSMSQPATEAGVVLGMDIVIGTTTFQLLLDSTPFTFTFAGSFPFPSQITETLTVGSVVTTTITPPPTGGGCGTTTPPPTTTAACPCGLPNCDVNGDGIFNEADIRAIKDALVSRNPNPKADANGDGVVNIQDLIAALQALDQSEIGAGEGKIATACGTTTGTGTTTTGTPPTTGTTTQ
jgi:hypothetical protein